jgi:hypothetical protein
MQQLPVRLTLAQCSRQLAGIRKLLLHLLFEHFCRLIIWEPGVDSVPVRM